MAQNLLSQSPGLAGLAKGSIGLAIHSWVPSVHLACPPPLCGQQDSVAFWLSLPTLPFSSFVAHPHCSPLCLLEWVSLGSYSEATGHLGKAFLRSARSVMPGRPGARCLQQWEEVWEQHTVYGPEGHSAKWEGGKWLERERQVGGCWSDRVLLGETWVDTGGQD